jgi:2-iminobutanoate/2-iminopropanoate deaminase
VSAAVPIVDPSLYPPPAPMSHAVRADSLLVVGGQVPRQPDGDVPTNLDDQVELALANLGGVLRTAGLSFDDVIFLRAYVTDRQVLEHWREIRPRWLGDARPAATMVVVAGLADERWKIEIEAVAWRSP